MRQPSVSLQYLPRSVLGIDLLNDALQNAVFVEDEGAAQSAEHGFAVHFLFAPGAEGLEHFGGGVREQAEGELEFGLEARMRSGAVLAHAHHVEAGGCQGGVIVPEGTRLGSAAGGVVFGVEVNNRLSAFADKVL